MKKCENCQMHIPDNSPECPHCGMKISGTERSTKLFASYKIAAIMLIINSLFLIIEIFVMEEYDIISHSFGGIIGSLVIGILVLANKRGALIWARIAIILGAAIFTIIQLINKNYPGAVLQVLFSLSLIGLIFGKPKRLRIVLCCAFLIFYSFLEIDGLQSEFSGKSMFVQALTSMRGLYESIEDSTVYGSNNSYSLEIPNANWKKRSRRYVAKENPVADFWLIHPDYDAHVITICEIAAEDAIINLDLLTNTVIQNARDVSENLKIEFCDSLILPSGIVGRSFIIIREVDSLIIQYKYGIFLIRNHAFQIVCFSTKEIFSEVEHDFDKIINSFSPHPDLVSHEVEE